MKVTEDVALRDLIARAGTRGWITVDELNAVLPDEQVSSEQIEDVMTLLSELDIDLVDPGEPANDV